MKHGLKPNPHEKSGDNRKPINLQALRVIRNVSLKKDEKGSQTNLEELVDKSDQIDTSEMHSPTF